MGLRGLGFRGLGFRVFGLRGLGGLGVGVIWSLGEIMLPAALKRHGHRISVPKQRTPLSCPQELCQPVPTLVPSQPYGLKACDFKTGTLNPKSETLNLELPPRFNSIKRSVEGLLPLDDDTSFAWEARGDEMMH